MTMGRGALLGACLALPLVCQVGPAGAAQPEGGRYVYVPAGATVVVLPGPGVAVLPHQTAVAPVDFPVARLIARQEAMMRRMMADMDSLMTTSMPDPERMIRSVMQGMPMGAPGSGVVMTSMSSGNGTCSRTITYGYPADGGQPQVKVTQTGDACGAIIPSGAPIGVMQAVPPVPPAPVQVAPRHDRLWKVGYPPHPVATEAPPRT
jgi:hypothetical protein